MSRTVHLSGEIHGDWRQQISEGARAHDLPAHFTSAVTNHAAGVGNEGS